MNRTPPAQISGVVVVVEPDEAFNPGDAGVLTWEVNEAKGALKQNGKVLEGVLKDKTDGKADYQIRIELNGGQAEAIFRFISKNDKGTTLTGIYKKTAKPTKTHCPEQI